MSRKSRGGREGGGGGLGVVRGTGDPASRGPWAARLTGWVTVAASGPDARSGAALWAEQWPQVSVPGGLPTVKWAGSRTAGSEGGVRGSNYSGFPGGPVLVMSHSVFKIASGKFVSSFKSDLVQGLRAKSKSRSVTWCHCNSRNLRPSRRLCFWIKEALRI